MIIRAARPSEREQLEQLQWRASLPCEDYREMLLANPDAIELPVNQITDGDLFVAEIHNKIAGFAAVYTRTDGALELDGLFVEPALQRQGFGRALVKHCIHQSRERRRSALCVIANSHAIDSIVPAALRSTERLRLVSAKL